MPVVMLVIEGRGEGVGVCVLFSPIGLRGVWYMY